MRFLVALLAFFHEDVNRLIFGLPIPLTAVPSQLVLGYV
jgi:hypothetical protein